MKKSKTIRDVIHGDIHVNEDFIKIIDTPEFQRLRRIHQLSIAYLLFPGADHTRYSHSLGTFYIMKHLIKHFEKELLNVNIKINERDKNVALVSALLHDIGHGPFSHAFEESLKDTKNKKSHEDWTIEIINNKDSKINEVLIEIFDKNFPRDVASLIQEIDLEDSPEFDLFYILKSLISSQLDADRMDYLLRDSFYTGVVAGQIDISRLIDSLSITTKDNNYYICINKKFLPNVEEYLLARYHMNNGVYYHNFKCKMECIIEKIIKRAIELNNKNLLDTSCLSEPIRVIIENNSKLTVKQYLELDDNVLLNLFTNWRNHEDYILSELCKTLIDRKKFKKLKIFTNSKKDIERFKISLIELLKKYNYNTDANKLKKSYFWIELDNDIDIYKYDDENIWVLDDDGVVKELTDVSLIIKKQVNKSKDTNLKTSKNCIFLNFELLKYDLKSENVDKYSIEKCIDKVRELIKIFDSRKNIEIERKYNIANKISFDKIQKILNELLENNEKENQKYKFESSSTINQVDTYFQDYEKSLINKNATLRIREKNSKKTLTLKIPVNRYSQKMEFENQSERFEEEIDVKFSSFSELDEEKIKNDILSYIPSYMSEEIKELKDPSFWKKLTPIVEIKNKRSKYIIKEPIENSLSASFEIVLDDLVYRKNDNEVEDFQMEIELDSDDYRHRVNLKRFTDMIEEKINKSMDNVDIFETYDSKFERAMELLK